MLLFVRDEQELAGFLAHEIGHVITHQAATNLTFLLRNVLNVTQVSDRADLIDKIDQLERNWRRNRQAFQTVARRGPEAQVVADQVAVYLLARAGYSTRAFVEFLDRAAEASDHPGSWISELFHIPKPNEIRLRELRKAVNEMPEACYARRTVSAAEGFRQWQEAAIEFSNWGRPREKTPHGVLAEIPLQSPLGMSADVRSIRFSPDGHYLLAVGHGRIHILTREPLAYRFSIEAPSVVSAQFTPDSQSIAFSTFELRIEVWDISSQKRTSAFEPALLQACSTSSMAPDGKTLACATDSGTLILLDAATGEKIMEKKGRDRSSQLAFSPDGRYFLAAGPEHTTAFDMSSKSNVAVGRDLSENVSGGFTFLGSDRVVGRDIHTWQVSLLSFPNGKFLARLPVGWENFRAPAHGNYLLVSGQFPGGRKLGVLDLRRQKYVLSSKESVCDLYDQTFAVRTPDGMISLFDVTSLAQRDTVSIPGGTLLPTTVEVSPNLKWLAVSKKDKGGIWDLSTGKRAYELKGFRGGWFSDDGWFDTDFPALEDTPHEFVRLSLGGEQTAQSLKVQERYAKQVGPFILVQKPQTKAGLLYADRGDLLSLFGALARPFQPCRARFADFSPFDCDVIAEVLDASSGRALWSRRFPKDAPTFLLLPERGQVLLTWPAASGAAQEELKKSPELLEEFKTLKEPRDLQLLEILDATSGGVLRTALLRRMNTLWTLAETRGQESLAIFSGPNDTTVESLSGRTKPRHFPGRPLAVSEDGSLLAVSREHAEISVYNTHSGEELDEQGFAAGVLKVQFSRDGKRMLVLTDAQDVYLLQLPAASRN